MRSQMTAKLLLLLFVIGLLVMSWEYQMTNAALAAGVIPEEAIRLRILADSDAPHDQWLKRKVRDRVMASMREWMRKPEDIDAARARIRAKLPELETLVGEVLREHGFDYEYKVQFDEVPFPAKLYGNKVYPAGMYEALLITIGKGEGRNWWCVLFPPLCFVGAVSADAGAQDQVERTGQSDSAGEQPQMKFFLVELIERIIQFISS